MARKFPCARNIRRIVGGRIAEYASFLSSAARRHNGQPFQEESPLFTDKFAILLVAVVLAATGCVNPQQVELLEREQRRLRSDVGTMQTDIDAARTSLADARANMQQMQREAAATANG